MLKQANTKKQGNVGLGIAIAHFVSLGYTVAIPLTDSQDYDLVVEIDGQLEKVQVKTTTHKAPSGFYKVTLRTTGGNQSWSGVVKYFDEKDADILFVVANNGDKWMIRTEEISNRNSITLGAKYDQYRI